MPQLIEIYRLSQSLFYICSMTELNIIWFRRDLRVHDHAALASACAAGGQIVPLFIFEPNYWQRADTSERQFEFAVESLADLDRALRQRGSQLCLRSGVVTEVLSRLHAQHGIASLHFHSLGNTPAEAEQDRQVRTWALKVGIPLREHTGIQHSISPHSDWDTAWRRHMRKPRIAAPAALPPLSIPSEGWPIASDFGLESDGCPNRQTGGRTNAILQLRWFLSGGGRNAGKANLSITACEATASRLSAHLTMGSVSEREVWQAAMKAQAALVTDGDETFATALHRFTEKLAKRSRRVQASARVSLTDTSLLPVDIHNREEASLADPRLSAWTNGKTGFPLLDASMRCLQATGHLESSLRSLLLSFATCHLWLGPVRPAQVLAQLCTDFAPAMYYVSASQVIGLSKAAPAYIPNPVRQSLSRDPDGAFIRKWIPEIAKLPDQYLHAPWEAPKSALSAHGIILGQSYPMPLVDHVAAAREAKRRLSPDGASRPLPFHSIARKPLGIRRSTIGRNMTAKRSGHSPIQLSFDLQSQA